LEKGSNEDIPQTLRLEAVHYFGSLRNAFVALKQIKAFARLEQGKNYHRSFPDAPLQRKAGLRQITT
jgi:hypothetical protein